MVAQLLVYAKHLAYKKFCGQIVVLAASFLLQCNEDNPCFTKTDCYDLPVGFICGKCPTGYSGGIYKGVNSSIKQVGVNLFESYVPFPELIKLTVHISLLMHCPIVLTITLCSPTIIMFILLQQCIDIDECATNNGGCHNLRTCNNTVVSTIRV